MLIGMQSVQAEISIERLTANRLHNVTQQRVIDDDGNFCALIKLKTEIKGIMIDANQARPKRYKNQDHDQTVYLVEPQCESHPDEVWIYLSSKTKRLRLFHPTYGGMNEESEEVRSGYYYLTESIHPELIYKMEIKCEEAQLQALTFSPNLPTLVEAQFHNEEDAVRMYIDRSRVRPGENYLVSAGEHTFKAKRLFYESKRQHVEAIPGQLLDLSASLERIPVNLFGGIEVGKPTSYSDLAYGFRVGIICRLGLYLSYLTTIGYTADGDAVQPDRLQYEPFAPYSDSHCQYNNWNVGLILNCVAGLHVYAGVGQASRSVNWLGLDSKRHELLSDQYDGFSWEAGVMYNVKKFYLSAGIDCVDGSYGGRVGIGVYLNVLK